MSDTTITPPPSAPIPLGGKMQTVTQDNSPEKELSRFKSANDALNLVAKACEDALALLGTEMHPAMSDARSIIGFVQSRIDHQRATLNGG